MTPLFIEGMRGLGDNIYQRPFIRAASKRFDVYLETPWPELYEDLPINFIGTATSLRTQAKNIARQSSERWSAIPSDARRIRISYGSVSFGEKQSIIKTMESILPLHGDPLVMDLPNFVCTARRFSKPIAVVRPVTVRREWRNEARNPLPEYIAEVSAELMNTHYVVSVADLAEGQEWLVGDPPPAHERIHDGSIPIRPLLGLLQSARAVVGGVGWIVPAAIAAGVPAFIVLGGQGGHNAPECITDSRLNIKNIAFIAPDRYCRCVDMMHRCDKTITGLIDRFRAWRDEQDVSGVARVGADLAT